MPRDQPSWMVPSEFVVLWSGVMLPQVDVLDMLLKGKPPQRDIPKGKPPHSGMPKGMPPHSGMPKGMLPNVVLALVEPLVPLALVESAVALPLVAPAVAPAL